MSNNTGIKQIALHRSIKVDDVERKRLPTWLFLPWFGQVGDTCVRTHEDVAGMQGALQETLLSLRYVDATQRSFRKIVGRNKSEAVHPNLVDAVNGLTNTQGLVKYIIKARQKKPQKTCLCLLN